MILYKKAFTLTEMVLVVIIVAILSFILAATMKIRIDNARIAGDISGMENILKDYELLYRSGKIVPSNVPVTRAEIEKVLGSKVSDSKITPSVDEWFTMTASEKRVGIYKTLTLKISRTFPAYYKDAYYPSSKDFGYKKTLSGSKTVIEISEVFSPVSVVGAEDNKLHKIIKYFSGTVIPNAALLSPPSSNLSDAVVRFIFVGSDFVHKIYVVENPAGYTSGTGFSYLDYNKRLLPFPCTTSPGGVPLKKMNAALSACLTPLFKNGLNLVGVTPVPYLMTVY